MRVPFFTLQREYKKYKKEIDKAVATVLASQSFVLGEQLSSFEKELSSFLSIRHAVGVGSGTDALILALHALGVGPGDEVITQPNSFVATVTAIEAVGASPQFIDIDPDTYQMNVVELQKKISPKTKAVIPVHMYGAPSQIDEILRIARKHKIAVVEDACQAHGAMFKKKKMGTFGDMGVFSFYPSKNLGAYGEAGCIVTNNATYYRKLLMMRNHGQKRKYEHVSFGVNSRLDEIQAAVLRVKLRHLDEVNRFHRRISEYYQKRLDIKMQQIIPDGYSNFYVFVVESDKRNALQKKLLSRGVSTLIHYPIPIHLQKRFSKYGYKKGDFPKAELLSSRCLSLPLFVGINKSEVEYVCKIINQEVKKLV